MDPVVVSFHTPDDLYTAYAMRLKESCLDHGIESVIVELPSRGNWLDNVRAKASFCGACHKRVDGPFVWIDADAIVCQPLDLLRHTEASVGISTAKCNNAEWWKLNRRPARRQIGRKDLFPLPMNWPVGEPARWFNSGTIYFANNDESLALTERWTWHTAQHPRHWDQWTLQMAWADLQPKTLWLPPEYCRIRKMHSRKMQTDNHSVIVHGLASCEQNAYRG